MTKLVERVRSRRAAHRQERALHSALRDAASPSLRRELIEIASRYGVNQMVR
jgi:hypothetical protein